MQGIIHHHKTSLSLKLPLRAQIHYPCGLKPALSAGPAPAGKTHQPIREKSKTLIKTHHFSRNPLQINRTTPRHLPHPPYFHPHSALATPHFHHLAHQNSSPKTSPFSPRQPRDCRRTLPAAIPSPAKFSSRRLPGRSRVLLLRFGDAGGIAQRSEQAAHNCLVHGSNPCAPISSFRFSPGMVVLPRRMHHDYLFAL